MIYKTATALALCLLAATANASAIQRNECSIRADIAAAAYQARQEGYDLRTVIHVIKERGIIDRPPYLAVVKRAYQAPDGMPPRDFRISVFEKCISSNYLKETQ